MASGGVDCGLDQSVSRKRIGLAETLFRPNIGLGMDFGIDSRQIEVRLRVEIFILDLNICGPLQNLGIGYSSAAKRTVREFQEKA